MDKEKKSAKVIEFKKRKKPKKPPKPEYESDQMTRLELCWLALESVLGEAREEFEEVGSRWPDNRSEIYWHVIFHLTLTIGYLKEMLGENNDTYKDVLDRLCTSQLAILRSVNLLSNNFSQIETKPMISEIQKAAVRIVNNIGLLNKKLI